eukprot:4128119-Alexandrium_andersonii.AAC.1
MSASLVGSEMCIRDSLRGALAGGSCGPLPAARYRAAVPGPRGRSAGTSVSYTHLTLPTICSV